MCGSLKLLKNCLLSIALLSVVFVTQKTANQHETYFSHFPSECNEVENRDLDVDSFQNDYLFFRKQVQFVRKENVLYAHGFIQDSILDQLKKHKINLIVLHSKGGSTISALKIANHIRTHNISTYVYPGAYCFSACAIIWAAGTYRALGTHSSLMFHSSRVPDLCLLKSRIYKKYNGNIYQITNVFKKIKLNLEKLDNKKNLILLDFLGVDFLDWYLSNQKKDYLNAILGNLLETNDVYLEAAEALKRGFSHETVGTIFENHTYINGLKTFIRLPSYKIPKIAFSKPKNYVVSFSPRDFLFNEY